MAALENGLAAVAASSGKSAQFMAIANIASSGDNIVASTSLFGGTVNQFKGLIGGFGIDVKWVKTDDPEDFRKAIDEKTKGVYIESIGNPRLNVPDIAEIAKVAHEAEIPLIVDNTFGIGGFLIRPIDHGADIVVHSATKWIGGHGTTIGGVIISSGKFDFTRGKFPSFTEPSKGFHGLGIAETYGPLAFNVKLRMKILTDLGACLNPFAAFQLLQGLETLSLRGERHSANALALAQWLERHPKVLWVSYPGLPSHPYHEHAKKTFRPGYFGGMLTFGIEDGGRFVDNLILVSNLANVGDTKTLVLYPAVTSHQHMTADEQLLAGVTPDMIRISVGIENVNDIIADFEEALEVISDSV